MTEKMMLINWESRQWFQFKERTREREDNAFDF